MIWRVPSGSWRSLVNRGYFSHSLESLPQSPNPPLSANSVLCWWAEGKVPSGQHLLSLPLCLLLSLDSLSNLSKVANFQECPLQESDKKCKLVSSPQKERKALWRTENISFQTKAIKYFPGLAQRIIPHPPGTKMVKSTSVSPSKSSKILALKDTPSQMSAHNQADSSSNSYVSLVNPGHLVTPCGNRILHALQCKEKGLSFAW